MHVLVRKGEKDSLEKRYLYKLSTNLISVPIGFITQVIILRSLGPHAYGNFNFLTNFFIQVTGFFDSGTSMGFYTKLSQRLEESGLVRFYWGFVAIITILIVFLVSSIFLLNGQNRIWVEQESRYIWMGLFWGLLYWMSGIVHKIVDAYGLTVRGELVRIKQKLVGLAILGVMFLSGNFTLALFFLYHFFMFFVLLILWWNVLRVKKIGLIPKERLSKVRIKSYSSEFYRYSMPLFTYALVGLVTGILDRWLLQKYGGSAEQGYYSLSYQIGAICFLFTSALTPLFMREMSIAYGRKDVGEMKLLFVRYIPKLYSIAACIGVFFSFRQRRFV